LRGGVGAIYVFDLQAVFAVSVFSFHFFYFFRLLLKNGVSSNHHPEWKSTWCTFFTARNFFHCRPFSNPHTNTVNILCTQQPAHIPKYFWKFFAHIIFHCAEPFLTEYSHTVLLHCKQNRRYSRSLSSITKGSLDMILYSIRQLFNLRAIAFCIISAVNLFQSEVLNLIVYTLIIIVPHTSTVTDSEAICALHDKYQHEARINLPSDNTSCSTGIFYTSYSRNIWTGTAIAMFCRRLTFTAVFFY